MSTQVTQRKKLETIKDFMNSPEIVKKIHAAAPKHLTGERLAQVAMTEINRNPALSKASPISFVGAIMQCGALGLEPSGSLGHAYLIPFGNGKDSQGRPNIQLIIGYRGMLDLAKRSGQISSISARAVYENDDFNYSYGLEETVHHIPASGERGNLTHVYAVARMKDGGVQFEVMSVFDVNKIRDKSPSAKGSTSPWTTYYEEMAKKTVIRRLFKYLPISIEMQKAVTIDEQGDAGVQNNAADFGLHDDIIEHDANADLDAAMERLNTTGSDAAANEMKGQ